MPEYPKLLVNKGKHGNQYILVEDETQEDSAWLTMFKAMDKWCEYYDTDWMEGDELDAYKGAKRGDADAAKWFLEIRSDNGYEYEYVGMETLDTPESLLERLND